MYGMSGMFSINVEEALCHTSYLILLLYVVNLIVTVFNAFIFSWLPFCNNDSGRWRTSSLPYGKRFLGWRNYIYFGKKVKQTVSNHLILLLLVFVSYIKNYNSCFFNFKIKFSIVHGRVFTSCSGIPRNFFFFGGGSTNSVEDRGQRGRGSGGSSPLVRGSGGSCNLVQEISFHIVTFS